MQRDSLLDKIRALLSKTVSNGCTEHEALAALDKARAMMDAYEVSEEELKLAKEEAAILKEDNDRDPHNIKWYLSTGIAAFCDVKVWRRGGARGTLIFCGLPSDVAFADWLMQSLVGFVQSELANHLMGCVAPKGERRFIINGFVAGCTTRISHRMRELARQSKAAPATSSNSQALVVVKSNAIAEKVSALGLHFSKARRRSQRRMDGAAFGAGRAAGDRASFGRPVGAGAAALLK